MERSKERSAVGALEKDITVFGHEIWAMFYGVYYRTAPITQIKTVFVLSLVLALAVVCLGAFWYTRAIVAQSPFSLVFVTTLIAAFTLSTAANPEALSSCDADRALKWFVFNSAACITTGIAIYIVTDGCNKDLARNYVTSMASRNYGLSDGTITDGLPSPCPTNEGSVNSFLIFVQFAMVGLLFCTNVLGWRVAAKVAAHQAACGAKLIKDVVALVHGEAPHTAVDIDGDTPSISQTRTRRAHDGRSV